MFYPKTIGVIAVFMGFSLLLHGIKHITIKGQTGMIIHNWLVTFGKYLLLMGRSFSRPERFRMFWKRYVTEMAQLGINSIGIVLLISFFIGAVICFQM